QLVISGRDTPTLLGPRLCWQASSLIQSASYPRSASNTFFEAMCREEPNTGDRRAPHPTPGVRATGPAGHWYPPPGDPSSLGPSRATHILVIVVRGAGFVLVHAHDGGIDHPGGVDANALQRPKRFFGTSRNIEEGRLVRGRERGRKCQHRRHGECHAACSEGN